LPETLIPITEGLRIKTESLEIGDDLDSRRLKNKNLHFESKDVKKIFGLDRGRQL
jgi:hypothetical protein